MRAGPDFRYIVHVANRRAVNANKAAGIRFSSGLRMISRILINP